MTLSSIPAPINPSSSQAFGAPPAASAIASGKRPVRLISEIMQEQNWWEQLLGPLPEVDEEILRESFVKIRDAEVPDGAPFAEGDRANLIPDEHKHFVHLSCFNWYRDILFEPERIYKRSLYWVGSEQDPDRDQDAEVVDPLGERWAKRVMRQFGTQRREHKGWKRFLLKSEIPEMDIEDKARRNEINSKSNKKRDAARKSEKELRESNDGILDVPEKLRGQYPTKELFLKHREEHKEEWKARCLNPEQPMHLWKFPEYTNFISNMLTITEQEERRNAQKSKK